MEDQFVRGGLAPWKARLIAEHVDANLADGVQLSCLAELAQLSTSHFSRAFKATFGQPFTQYLVQQRLLRARALMERTCHTLGSIAARCGFSDQAHFSRLFRRQNGVSPRTWRGLLASGDVSTLRPQVVTESSPGLAAAA